MSESSELDEIRQRKLEELKQSLQDGTGAGETAGETPTEPVHITGANHFTETLQEYDVVFVDFYADWCGPCKMLEPTVEALARETDAAVAKVDIDAHQDLAMQYQVRGVPTVMLFSGGEAAERMTGVRDKSHYTRLIEQYTN